jgi:predicted nucleic acid-binding Zn finger protein
MEQNYFTSRGFIEVGKEIYIYENFLSADELIYYNSIIDAVVGANKWEKYHDGTLFENKVTQPIQEIDAIRDKMIDLLGNEYNLGKSLSVNRMMVGDTWKIHADNHDFIERREKAKRYVEGPFELVQNNLYGTVLYFNEFDGGELFYPDQCIVYKPKPGNLLIHSAEEFCTHGVARVNSGHRYSYSNFLSKDMKIPL